MICVSIQDKTYGDILRILERKDVEMAEIRLDRCPLSIDEIEDLFGNSDTPLIATCRIDEVGEAASERLLGTAIRAGARFADLEIEASPQFSKSFRRLCGENGTEIIRSFHDFEGTPDVEVLQMALARCFRYGADIAKIVTTCRSEEDVAKVESLYSIILEDIPSLEGKLVAFGMGEAGRKSRVECLRRGAPFTYAALSEEQATAPGQMSISEMRKSVYGDFKPYHSGILKMNASKSFAQRAILAAALARGTSLLHGYTPCDDSEAAIAAARAIGAEVSVDGDTLTIRGIDASTGSISCTGIDCGESGLLTRLMIPVLAAIGKGDFTISGKGTLLHRPLGNAAEILAAFGVLISSGNADGGKEVHVPARVRGTLMPGNAEIPGSGGSQLISGLLTALPLCREDSSIFVDEPKSIPYMYMTLDVLRHFGIRTRSEMEGDAELLEAQDWSGCSGISFKIKGGQHYKAADFNIEGDWSAAANFLVAGAIFGEASVEGLDTKSLQADLAIVDILVDAGAVVSQTDDDGVISVRKAPLEAFDKDLGNSPDLFPIVAVLAAFCAGESRISGVGRLAGKESDRAQGILEMLGKAGVEARIEGDDLVVYGESLCSRLLNGRLLHGGAYSSHHDHRMVMALKVVSLGSGSPVEIDDESCVAKSFPEFFRLFEA